MWEHVNFLFLALCVSAVTKVIALTQRYAPFSCRIEREPGLRDF